MPSHPRRRGLAAALATPAAALALLLSLGLTACGGQEPAEIEPTPEETVVAEAPSATPTTVERREPTPTPTPDDPWYAVEADGLPGVPVPQGAELVGELSPADEDRDARADYALGEDMTLDELYEWYLETMPEWDWDEGEDKDGGLVFLHQEQLSARYAAEGLSRTATVIFEAIVDGADFSLLVEAPEGEEADDESADDDATSEDEAADEEDEDATETDETEDESDESDEEGDEDAEEDGASSEDDGSDG